MLWMESTGDGSVVVGGGLGAAVEEFEMRQSVARLQVALDGTRAGR